MVSWTFTEEVLYHAGEGCVETFGTVLYFLLTHTLPEDFEEDSQSEEWDGTPPLGNNLKEKSKPAGNGNATDQPATPVAGSKSTDQPATPVTDSKSTDQPATPVTDSQPTSPVTEKKPYLYALQAEPETPEAAVKLLRNPNEPRWEEMGPRLAKVFTHPHNWKTPLHCAAANGHDEMCLFLISIKHPLNLCTRQGSTPLVWAIMNRRISTAQLLLRAGADPSLCTSDGQDAFAWAHNKGISDELWEHLVANVPEKEIDRVLEQTTNEGADDQLHKPIDREQNTKDALVDSKPSPQAGKKQTLGDGENAEVEQAVKQAANPEKLAEQGCGLPGE